uniref:RH1 domain-containing protein n=1 Tax=Haemonchus contortus TaxID=6289 RepID=A0A7I5E9N8_HAECO
MMSLPLVTNYEVYVAEGCQKPYCDYHRRMATVQRGASPQSPSKHITVVDVYDLAASIGKDFEKIIELHGNDCVRGIMPKVISALETLESLANNNERENEEILSLQKTVERLEHEKQARQLQTAKFEEELDQVEETYKKDINELRSMVKALMSENKTLSTTVSSLPANTESPTTAAMREEDVRLMFELKEMSHKQKEEIKALQRDVEQYACEVENLQNSIEKLIRQNEELLRKNSSLQKQGRMIVEEKMEIIRRLEKTEEANIQLRRLLSDTDRVCKDLQQANQVDDEPRFTLAELREVLQEKNVLKGRVMELEEELENLRPGRKEREREDLLSSPTDPSPSPPPGVSSQVLASDEPRTGEESDEVLVYGPLPREPDEKLYPWKYERKDSGVRRFFRFFKEFGTNPPQRRGSSTTCSPRPQRANASGN